MAALPNTLCVRPKKGGKVFTPGSVKMKGGLPRRRNEAERKRKLLTEKNHPIAKTRGEDPKGGEGAAEERGKSIK